MEKGFTMRAVSHRIPTEFGNDVYVALEDFDRRLYFRWDLTTDTIDLNKPVPQNNYDIPSKIACASSMLWHSALIHPDETHLLRVYLHTISAILNGIATGPATPPASCGSATAAGWIISGLKSISSPITTD